MAKTTAWNRRKREAEDKATGQAKRRNKERKAPNTCTNCGHPKTKEFGHSQFRGQSYCPKVATLSKEDWLAAKKAEAAEKRRRSEEG
jgi:hypothetical protein